MSRSSVQFIQIALVSSCFLIIVIRLTRKKALSIRYAIGWASICVIGILGAALSPFSLPISSFLQISEIAFVAGIAIVLLLSVCIQLSVSISGLQKQVMRLSEEIGLMKSQDTK